MRVDATFIGIEVSDGAASDTALAAKLEEVCPVDIYARGEGGTLRVVEENVDECVLCELCIRTAPPRTLRVLKLYDGSALERS